MSREKRIAVVTGAAQGIGQAIAGRLASEGYRVAIVDINEAKAEAAAAELTAQGFDAASFACDVSDVESITAMITKVVNVFDGIDVVVNNAGILHSTPIPQVTAAEWDRVMAVNLKSVFFVIQQALPYLKQSSAPRVINISSLAGRMGGFETGMAYTASKGAIISLTYGMARQLAPFGITVNAVCPGTTESEMITQWSQEQIDSLLNRIPLRKLAKPANIASAVTYLASEEAEFITGLLMDVNGGMYFG
ncbi:MAG: SDR family NAD(P)-dependent oxidoreductase [Saccharofermentanales bacterium]|jgi:3-oxoacyl-[acyl-carrier protein] reductase